MENIEINLIDRRYENLRIRNEKRERYILNSIMECGLRDPLVCTQTNQRYVLLDGYKRLRSLIKLQEYTVRISLISKDLTDGIFRLIRQSGANNLKILEEAGFIEEVKKINNLSSVDIAKAIGRSPAWVCLRQNLLSTMSEYAKKEMFAGRFPTRSYLYDLKKFTRVNFLKSKEVDEFISCVAGKRLSARIIARLADMYFNGSNEIKLQIKQGDIEYTLRRIGVINGIASEEQGKSYLSEGNLFYLLKLLKSNLNKAIAELDKEYISSQIFPLHNSLLKTVMDKLRVLTNKLEKIL